ncbi:MAG TPA: glycosyltransferase [Solirubrobacteraceae bacterium]|nr:glycosyltransferase [Solirubrobacteraceae bacterium]
MIAFGCSITAPDVYARCAEPGMRRAAEPDSQIIANAAAGSLFRSYNLIMDSMSDREDLEALVLVHQDAEITDPDFCRKLRDTLRDPEVGVVGCVGAIDVRSIAWWEGSVTWASFTHRYSELGGGEIPSLTWLPDDLPGYARTGEVDTLDGFVLALSPWAVHNVRFDESLGQIHGYDLDFCLQVRESGRKVVTADFKVVHHHSLQLVTDPDVWIAAHMKVAEKWYGRMPGIGLPDWGAASEDWRHRARKAEAEAGATRLERVSMQLQAEARERQLLKELAEVTGSTSWRATAPLRRLGIAVRAWQRNGSAR